MTYLILLGGFILLIAGAEIFVRGSVGIAHKLSLSPLVIGLTVVAFGTSAPELIVSLQAGLKGSAGISIGNVVGSNIANVLLVLALTAVLCPVKCQRREFVRDWAFMSIISLIFALLCLTGVFVRTYGIFMVALLVAFIIYNYFDGKKKNITDNEEVEELAVLAQKKWSFIILATVIGLAGVLLGADLLVKSAVMIATDFGISEEVIGLTIIAFGTSLPEFATSVVAGLKKQNDVVLGNIIGSNIWNILLIIGATSMIVPINVAPQIAHFDVWVMLGASLILLPLMIRKNQLGRISGIVLTLSYFVYVYMLYAKTIG